MTHQEKLEKLHDEISLLKNFDGDLHYTLKHIKYMENDLKFHKERLEVKCDLFKDYAQRHLGLTLVEAEKIIYEILREHKK